MEKLPTFHSEKHEFTYFAICTMKNTMAIQAIERHLNTVAEMFNELIDRGLTSVDLETFKTQFLSELETALAEVIDTTEVHDTDDTDEKVRLDTAEIQLQILSEKVAKLQSVVGSKKFDKSNNVFDLLI
ncbi:hypothetical protein [Microcoleus sp. D2_18a_B4]|uniref:hypothetical protein n=1 Tax=Microcoleus sp. D2_18a_B4 TaxID=3055329 RepID=UPI002FD19077